MGEIRQGPSFGTQKREISRFERRVIPLRRRVTRLARPTVFERCRDKLAKVSIEYNRSA